MGKNIINEGLTKMKYLLGYKRGLVKKFGMDGNFM